MQFGIRKRRNILVLRTHVEQLPATRSWRAAPPVSRSPERLHRSATSAVQQQYASRDNCEFECAGEAIMRQEGIVIDATSSRSRSWRRRSSRGKLGRGSMSELPHRSKRHTGLPAAT